MKDFSQAEALAEIFSPYSANMNSDGRPHVNLGGESIAAAVHDTGAYIGPAHAFTPWTGMYGRFDSLAECYGGEHVDFLELGLSADTSYGASIPELDGIPFLSNSDAHSPQLHKLGREFNRLEISGGGAGAVIDAILNGGITMNAGLLSEAERLSWKCPDDGGRIKEGVRDRAIARSGPDTGLMVRPPYRHIIPLGEIIGKVMGASSPCTKKCTAMYMDFIGAFGNEINVLVDVPVEDLTEIDPVIAGAIGRFRDGDIVLHPGGGGKYGSFDLN